MNEGRERERGKKKRKKPKLIDVGRGIEENKRKMEEGEEDDIR